MVASPRQIEANRRNALLSTGPKSEEGKDQSRRNALKHGGAGDGIVMLDQHAETIEERKITWRDSYVIQSPEDEFVFEQLVTASVQIEACQARASAVRSELAGRALKSWDDDRRDEVMKLAAGLSRKPELVYHALVRTRHGCAWIAAQWGRLGIALHDNGKWDAEQTSLAFDLLGTPLAFRHGQPGNPGEPPMKLVEREIEHHNARIEQGLDTLDSLRRELALQGRDPEPNRELNRLERYEAAAFRRFQWASDRLKKKAQTSVALITPKADPVAPKPAAPAVVALPPLRNEPISPVAARPATPVATPFPPPPAPRKQPVMNRRARRAMEKLAVKGKL